MSSVYKRRNMPSYKYRENLTMCGNVLLARTHGLAHGLAHGLSHHSHANGISNNPYAYGLAHCLSHPQCRGRAKPSGRYAVAPPPSMCPCELPFQC
jgi:hypothetical protein